MSLYDGIESAYELYTVQNFGDLSEADFRRYYPRAAAYISSLTMGRSENITDPALSEKVSLATFAVCEEMQRDGQNDGAGAIVSSTNDGISETYASSKDSRTVTQRRYDAAYPFLSGTGLLFRGVRR